METTAVFRRYVALGDSSTEGLEDPDGAGGYLGWADRLALTIARAQVEPMSYANLAIRGYRMHEIRERQLGPALALEPDLVSVFGGVNDVIGPRPHFGQIGADLEATFAALRATGATVITFAMPDPGEVSPIGKLVRERMFVLNDLIRATAAAHGVLLVDFAQHPVATDPRLWFADRLHGNALGHERVAAALAWRLGLPGSGLGWTEPIEPAYVGPHGRQRVTGDVDWAVHHVAPWLGKGIRRVPHGSGIEPKRPELEVVDPAATALDLRSLSSSKGSLSLSKRSLSPSKGASTSSALNDQAKSA